MKQCKNFKDSEELLEIFVTKYEQIETIDKEYDENGKVIKKEVTKRTYEYDELGRLLALDIMQPETSLGARSMTKMAI